MTALLYLSAAAAFAEDAPPASLKPATSRAFDAYIVKAEAEWDKHGTAVRGDRAKLRAGEVVTWKTDVPDVPSGLIHDWTGSILLKGTTLAAVTALVQNYDHHAEIYGPEVMASKLLSRDGNDFRIYLKLLKKKVLTVILDTEHDVRYFPIDATHMRSWSRTTKIAEQGGGDHGFLWRLNSYWRFEESDGGVYAECRAISLTRDVPFGTGWIIKPIVNSLPRESLEKTLTAKRVAVAK